MTGVAYTLNPIHPDPDSPEVWIITGASRGLGAEFVKQLLERGAHVAAGARDPGSSPPLQELARRFPQKLLLLTLDVASEESIKAAAAEVKKRFPGGIQFLVNSAGHGGAIGNVFEVTPQMFKECLNCNLLGPHLMYQSFVPLMTKSAGQGDSVFSVPHTNADDAKPSTTAGGESGDKTDAEPSAADGTPNGHAAPANGHAPEPTGHPAGRRLRRAVINLGSNMGSSEENRARLHTKQSVVPM